MECNRDEGLRAKAIAEGKLENKDFAGAKKFALKAQSLYPGLEGLSQLLTTVDVYKSADNKISGEVDWYGVLGVPPSADDETIRKQYRKLALLLHPDKNRTAGADGAFKLICEAWSLLSDKSKRLAYNTRRSPKGFQPNVPTHIGGPSAPPRANGYHNNTVKTPSAPKTQNNSARVPPPSVPRPCQRTDTFWTICHRCKMHYEYLKVYLNHTLLCPNCHEAFLASETAPPVNYSKSLNSTSSQRQQNSSNSTRQQNSSNSTRQQNSSNSRPASNFFDPRRNAAASANSGAVPGFHSSNSRDTSQDKYPSTAGVCSTDPSIAAKAASVVQQAHQRMKREQDESQAAAGGVRVYTDNSSFEIEGLSKRMRVGQDSYHFGANSSYQWTTGNGVYGVSGASLPRKVGVEFQGISGAYGKPFSIKELTPIENRNMLMGKARKEILKKLYEWKLQAASRAVDTEKVKVKDRKKENVRSTRNDDTHVLNEFVESSADRVVDQAKKSAFNSNGGDIAGEHFMVEAMNVPDPDFHDFDLDRAESSFEDNEVWAAYDDDDGMPRFYAMINKVISRKPFKLKISWLNSKSCNEFGSVDWIGSGFYKTCGEFRCGRHETYKSINSFSHKVNWSKDRGVVHIFPRKGDVWALYKNWSSDWNEHTPEELIHKYDMVVVLVDYNEENGVSVGPLVKVDGFKTVFLPNLDPAMVIRIPREEMFRFSHQVPYYRLTNEEAQNAPKGCLELDPAATPLDLLQVINEGNSGVNLVEIADGVSKANKEGIDETRVDLKK